MPIGVTEEHDELRQAVRRWIESHCPPSVPRALLDAEREERPAFWDSLAEPFWLGLHVAEEHGGAGFGLLEVAVVLEELGRAAAPGPFLSTVAAGAAIQDGGNDAAAKALLPGLAAGEIIGAVVVSGALDGQREGDGLRVSGTVRPVLSGHLADVVVVPVMTPEGEVWCVLDASELAVREMQSVDLTRRSAEIVAAGVVVPADRILGALEGDHVRQIVGALAAVEAIGVAQWCVETASEYAKVRVQFGRPIGQFQGVKHRCADMLARIELGRAAVWDAVQAVGDPEPGAALAVAAGASLGLVAGFECAKDCVQTLGGIGFTWEHDAHIYLRRASTLHQLAGTPADWRRRAAREALRREFRSLTLDLPPEAEAFRAELRTLLAEIAALDPQAQREHLVERGYVVPSWPKPYGREASALELLVIDEEFKAAGVARPNILIGGWALPPVIVFGTEEQQQRWIGPTLRGEITWCQLFSEPGAGSDLASLTTRATRTDGGWVLSGQKVWTSLAHMADWGFCLARTDPDAPKHDGITYFMLDMKASGIEIRPLRELTGEAMFNEVFLNEVFVPDDCVVGDVNDGWRLARTSLANERVFMGSNNTVGSGVLGVLDLLQKRGQVDDSLALDEVGGLVAKSHALAVLGFRLTLKALTGADPSGADAAVKKLLGVQHDQEVQEVGVALSGPDALAEEGEFGGWVRTFMFNRCLSIAGGTSDVQKNVIAERILGLPRDP